MKLSLAQQTALLKIGDAYDWLAVGRGASAYQVAKGC